LIIATLAKQEESIYITAVRKLRVRR